MEAILISTHNILFLNIKKKIILNYSKSATMGFVPRDSRRSSKQPWLTSYQCSSHWSSSVNCRVRIKPLRPIPILVLNNTLLYQVSLCSWSCSINILATCADLDRIFYVNLFSTYTVKNFRKFYGKITGNQLPVHFPLFLQAPVNIFRNQAQNSSKGHYCFFLSYSPTILQRYFRVLSINITLPYLDF